jgi:hypothetical protein
MKTPEQERRIQDDLPSPNQLAHLVSASIIFAHRYGKLRIKDTKEGDKKFEVLPLSFHERPDILSGAPFGTLYHYGLGAIAVRRAGNEWSTRMFKTIEAITMGSTQGGVREVYSFNWNEASVTQSRRTIVATPEPDQPDMYDLIDHFSMQDSDVTALELRDEMTYVTSGDITMLESELYELREGVETGERQYREPRKNYLDYFAQ